MKWILNHGVDIKEMHLKSLRELHFKRATNYWTM